MSSALDNQCQANLTIMDTNVLVAGACRDVDRVLRHAFWYTTGVDTRMMAISGRTTGISYL
jgi:hypothetical protein